MTRLEGVIAALLRYGCWAASGAIAVGLALGLAPLTAAGIVAFIALPILRVSVMLAVFCWDGDYRLAATAAVVLGATLFGFFLGPH